ncbi:hypothetical protein ACWD4L_15515 [Streptomyces sp. NPDC002596]
MNVCDLRLPSRTAAGATTTTFRSAAETSPLAPSVPSHSTFGGTDLVVTDPQ